MEILPKKNLIEAGFLRMEETDRTPRKGTGGAPPTPPEKKQQFKLVLIA